MKILRTLIFVLLMALFLFPLGQLLSEGIQDCYRYNLRDWKAMDFLFVFIMVGGGLLNALFLLFLVKIIANPKAGGFVRTFAFLILLPIVLALGSLTIAVVGSWLK
jgi:hypothetical protein